MRTLTYEQQSVEKETGGERDARRRLLVHSNDKAKNVCEGCCSEGVPGVAQSDHRRRWPSVSCQIYNAEEQDELLLLPSSLLIFWQVFLSFRHVCWQERKRFQPQRKFQPCSSLKKSFSHLMWKQNHFTANPSFQILISLKNNMICFLIGCVVFHSVKVCRP